MSALAKAVNFLLNMLIAFLFGAGTNTDIYFFCLSTIILASWFITSLNQGVVVPHSMHLAAEDGKRASMSFVNTFLYINVVGVCLLILLALCLPVKALALVSRFSVSDLDACRQMVKLFILALAPMMIATIMTDILFSHKYFVLPMVMKSISGILCIFSVILLHDTMGLSCIPITMAIAFTLQIAFSAYLMRTLLHWDFSLCSLRIKRLAVKNAGLVVLGNMATLASSYVPMVLMSGFSPGTLSSLNYAQNAANIPTQLITTPYSAVAGIRLNEACAKRDRDSTRRVFQSAVKLLIFVLVPIACLMSIFSTEIITILFYRGSMSSNTVALAVSGRFLLYLALLSPILAINTFVARLFMADQKILMAVCYQIAMNLLLVCLTILFVQTFGPQGYPVSQLALYTVSTIAFIALLKLGFPYIEYASILKYFVKVIILNAPLCLIVYGIQRTLSNARPIFSTLTAGVLYVSAIVVINEKWRLNSDAHRIVCWIREQLSAILRSRETSNDE